MIRSVAEHGTTGLLVDVECGITNGLPNIVIVGFANKAVEEAKERVRGAFSSSKLDFPRKRITINLAPADLPKDSSSFDLAIAAAILTASGQVTFEQSEKTVFIGELGLKGNVRPVRGIIGKLMGAKAKGITRAYIPLDNLDQACLVPGVTLLPIATVRDLYHDLAGTIHAPEKRANKRITITEHASEKSDFQDVVGQTRAKRALEIAAAGGHNVLLSGPPGTGKSMLAKALPSILPPMSIDEILETTQLHSLSSRSYHKIITTRPFRAPHHSASLVSIVGGGQHPRPGEVSLSHNGVLFMDELPEFAKSTLEALRQPLEDTTITVARAHDSITFPAKCMVVATANPCPCGYFGSTKPCTCLPQQIIKYQQKLSGPIIDRIDLYVDVDEVAHASLLNTASNEPSSAIRTRVIRARQKQAGRFNSHTRTNATLSNKEIKALGNLSSDAKILLDQAAERLSISARSYMRTLKVARTIADLDNSKTIQTHHISEALQYRKPAQTPL